MTLKKFALAGVLLAPFIFAATPAHAGDYCREYQKTIVVGGHYESGYGTACMQPDGSWMITDSSGTVDPFDQLRNQNVVLISDSRPVYYNYGPTYRPVTYYPRARYYQPARSSFFFSFGNNNHGWDRHDNRWDNNRWDHDDHDRGRGHGNGHGHH
jgi:hypothetical protein